MGLLSWLVIGVLVGLIAGKFFAVRGGWLPTLILATIGALVGGYISVYFNWGTLASLHPQEHIMSLESAPDEIKLAVDLIMLLEQSDVAPETVLAALEIVRRDYENKQQSPVAS